MKLVGMGVILTLAAMVSGCAVEHTAVASAAGRSTTHAVTVDGVKRTYRLYVPARLPAKAPLVVMLHGGFGTAKQAEKDYGWNARADKGRFAVVYPNGSGRAWNAGAGCCGAAGRNGVDDVAFITKTVADVRRAVAVDPKRIYATGMSNGGMMAYRLACDTRLFAAVAPVAATRLGGCRAPRPLSVLHIHGTADEQVRLDGAPGKGAMRIDGPPVRSVVKGWRTVARCKPPAITRSGPVVREKTSCREGRAVDLLTIKGAGHQWPGGADRGGNLLDPPSRALDATSAIWRFFAAHPKG